MQVTITDSKGRTRTATATKNITLSASAPYATITTTRNSLCSGTYQTWSLSADASAGSNWHWTVNTLGTNSNIYINNPYSSYTTVDVSGGGTVKLTYTDVCGGTKTDGITVYSNCPTFAYSISPNPAQNDILVNTNNQIVKSSFQKLIYGIKITDALGVLRKSIQYKSGINTTKISLTGLNSGVYLISVFDGKNWNSKQLIIQK